jgi:hypothetical protein
MNKKIIITLGILMCFTLVSAGVLIATNYEKDIGLNTTQISRIKLSSNVEKIDVIISPMQCNYIECFAKVFQENVIQSEWRRSKEYCSEYSEEENICLKYIDYTLLENQEAVKNFVNKKLGDYSKVEEVRKNKGSFEIKDAGGKIISAKDIVEVISK